MKKIYLTLVLTALFAASGIFSNAQCPAGSATANLNWDNLEYLTQGGKYAGFVTNAMMQRQSFILGTNRLTIDLPATMTPAGENTRHTGEAGSFGTGADVEITGTGAITITFDTVVFNFQMSLYDIDSFMKVNVTAVDNNGLPLNITMANVSGTTLAITGSGTTSANATASSAALALTDTKGDLNITVNGATPAGRNGVKAITISFTGPVGDFFISDFSACVFKAFPDDYYAPQKPWQGQPAYYLVTPDNNSVYAMNPLTGVAQLMFTEPSSQWVNSLAYDYNNKVVYYVMDHSTPISTNKSLKKYDFNTESISTVIADLTTLGIPLFDMVVESGGAAFYDGSLFLGIEGTNSTKTSARKSIIWRIDFDDNQNPVQAAQVFAQTTDDGAGKLTHDWGDFSIKDGVLYDFNTGNQTTTSSFIHLNMQSHSTTVFTPNGNPAPIQVGQTWDGKLYWTGGQGSETGRVAIYNENGTIGTKIVATVTACSPAWVGRTGDASDPFKPKSDFGDAPASYDPVADDKATHEYDCNLRLGNTYDREWDETPSSNASADGADEDGISTVTILTPISANYAQQIKVFNKTGANATLIGWLDFNGNGVFDAIEAKTLTIPTSTTLQTVTLNWPGIPVNKSAGSYTYLRIRITSATNGMTANTPNHWFANGEVEDYMVPVNFPLPVKLISLKADRDGDKVALTWKTAGEVNFSGYSVERSHDGASWNSIEFVPGFSDNQVENNYSLFDATPLDGRNYYRLKMMNTDGSFTYSDTKWVDMSSGRSWIRVTPNPADEHALLMFKLQGKGEATISIRSINGTSVSQRKLAIVNGINQVNIDDLLPKQAGLYIVQLQNGTETITSKLVVR